MSTGDASFSALIEQLRAGDERAALQIVRDYGRAIQIMVRARLVDRRFLEPTVRRSTRVREDERG